jgi:hypothetical protein
MALPSGGSTGRTTPGRQVGPSLGTPAFTSTQVCPSFANLPSIRCRAQPAAAAAPLVITVHLEKLWILLRLLLPRSRETRERQREPESCPAPASAPPAAMEEKEPSPGPCSCAPPPGGRPLLLRITAIEMEANQIKAKRIKEAG